MRTALFTDKDRYDILPSRKPDPDPTSAFLQKRLKKAISTRVHKKRSDSKLFA